MGYYTFDEAHRMSATTLVEMCNIQKDINLVKNQAKFADILLMTATPHNGKEEDFQLFMALLDGDRV